MFMQLMTMHNKGPWSPPPSISIVHCCDAGKSRRKFAFILPHSHFCSVRIFVLTTWQPISSFTTFAMNAQLSSRFEICRNQTLKSCRDSAVTIGMDVSCFLSPNIILFESLLSDGLMVLTHAHTHTHRISIQFSAPAATAASFFLLFHLCFMSPGT